ncbi:MAG: sigma-70 family RNA polymerase sigma factor [Acidimicrobiia bacterium]|nr:sigma-70 family RNA polymerase sigma factor [Acidimicrobiia bacterium]
MDSERFEELVRAHAPAVEAYARSIAPDRWVAEEATQETFLRAWQYLDSFRGEGSFEGWLIRICRSRVIELATARRAEPAGDELDDLVGTEPPDRAWEVLDELRALPVTQREAVVLCGLYGYDYESAAEIAGVPVGTIRSRLHRARGALASALRHGRRSA